MCVCVICCWFPFQPLFVALSQIWCGFQDEVVLLSVLSNLLTTLVPFTKVSPIVPPVGHTRAYVHVDLNFTLSPPPLPPSCFQNSDNVASSQDVTIAVNQSTVLSDEQRKEQVHTHTLTHITSNPLQTPPPPPPFPMAKASVHKVDPAKHRKAEFLFPENIKNFEQLPMEFAVSHPTNPLVLLVSTPFPPTPHPRGIVPAPWQCMAGWWSPPPLRWVCCITREGTLSSPPVKQQTSSLVTQRGEGGEGQCTHQRGEGGEGQCKHHTGPYSYSDCVAIMSANSQGPAPLTSSHTTPSPCSHPSLSPTPRFLSLAVATAKRAPELIQLLEMHSYLTPLHKGKVCVCVHVCVLRVCVCV